VADPPKKKAVKSATKKGKKEVKSEVGQYPRPAGALNAGILKKNPFRPLHTENRSTDIAQIWTESARTAGQTNNVESAGPFLAEVLRVEKTKQDTESVPSSIGALVDSTANTGGGDSPTIQLVQIRARIPELEYIPAPKNPASPDENDEELIEMHPVFTALDSSLPEPKVGDLVWVNFQVNREKQTGIYVGPLSDWVGAMIKTAIAAAGLFNCTGLTGGAGGPGTAGKPTGKKYSNNGLALSGKTFALPNSGLAPLPRRANLTGQQVRGQMPKGKGMFTYAASQTHRHPPAKLAKWAAWAGLSWVALRLPGSGGVQNEKDMKKSIPRVKQHAAELLKVGVVPFIWSGTGVGALRNPQRYTKLSIDVALAAGCAGLITDPEAHFYRHALGKTPTKKAKNKLPHGAIMKFFKVFNTAVHAAGLSVGFTSFGRVTPYGRNKHFKFNITPPGATMGWYDMAAKAVPGVQVFAIPQVYTARGKTNKDYGYHNAQVAGHRVAGFDKPIAVGQGAYGKGFHRWSGGSVDEHGPKPPSRMIEDILYGEYIDGAVIWWDWNNADHHYTQWGKTRWDVIRNAGNKTGTALNVAEVKTSEALTNNSTEIKAPSEKKSAPKVDGKPAASHTAGHADVIVAPEAKQAIAKTPAGPAQLVEEYMKMRESLNEINTHMEAPLPDGHVARFQQFIAQHTKTHGSVASKWEPDAQKQYKIWQDTTAKFNEERNELKTQMEAIVSTVQTAAKSQAPAIDPTKPAALDVALGIKGQPLDPNVYAR